MWSSFRIWVKRNEGAVKFIVWGISTVVVALVATVGFAKAIIISQIKSEISNLSYTRSETITMPPSGLNGWELRCDENDVALSYGFMPLGDGHLHASLDLKSAQKIEVNDEIRGFVLVIKNNAGSGRETVQVEGYVTCLRAELFK